MIKRPTFAKHEWALATAIAGAVSLLVFAGSAWWWVWRPGRAGGLVFGGLAAVLFVVAALYAGRQRLGARPFGTARRWLDAHIYGSLLATLFVFIHIGFQLPAGVMGWLLLGLSVWTAASGLAGAFLQRHIPRRLSRDLNAEAIYERIPALIAALTSEADEVMQGATAGLLRMYQAEIRPVICVVAPNHRWLTRPAAMRSAMLGPLAARSALSPGDRERSADLESIVRDKADLDAQLSLQWILRSWLVLHVPPAIVLLGLIVVHVAAVVWH